MGNFKLVKTATAFVLGATVVTSGLMAGDASAASKYKIKSGKLVTSKTGKVKKGFVTYKKTIYKNGKKYTGLRAKVYYKAGKVATGTYKGSYYVKGKFKVKTGYYNKGYYEKGKLAVKTGTYKGKQYSDGKLFTGTLNKKYYVNGVVRATTGLYKNQYYKDGRKATGTYKKAYYVKGKLAVKTGLYKNQYYKDGALNKGLSLYGGKLYKDAKLNVGFVLFNHKLYDGADYNKGIKEFDGKFYNKEALAEGLLVIDGKEELFEKGLKVEDKITSTKALTAKTIEVKFNKALDVKADDFTVTRDGIKVNVSALKVAPDKRSATVELASKISKGEYTVSLKHGETTLTSKFAAEDEKVSAIALLGDTAPLTTTSKATIALQVLNQYGENITSANYSGLNINALGSSVTPNQTIKANAQGQFEINLTNGKIGDKVNITVIDPATGISVNKTVTLSDAGVISSIEVGKLYNKDNKTLSVDSKATDEFYLPVTLKDQYGKEITDPKEANASVLVTNTNPYVVKLAAASDSNPFVTTKINDKDTLAIKMNTAEARTAGTTNFIFISKATGKSVTTPVAVEAGRTIADVRIGSPASPIISAKETVKFPLTITDNKGAEIKTKREYDALQQSGQGLILQTGKDATTVEEQNGRLYLVYKAPDTSGYSTIIATTKTGKVATYNITVRDEAKPSVITGLSADVDTSFRANQTTPLTVKATDLTVEDQYGRTMPKEALNDVDLTATASTAEDAPFKIEAGAAGSNSVVISKIAKDTATKLSDTITFKLKTKENPNGVNSSSYTKVFKIIKDADLTKFTIDKIPTVSVTKDNDVYKLRGGEYATDTPKVYGYNSANDKVLLKQGSDYNVSGVPTLNKAFFTDESNKEVTQKTVNMLITINKSGEKIPFSVTYSTEALKADKVELISTATDQAVTSINVSAPTNQTYTGVSILSSTTEKLVKTDQFGVKKILSDAADITDVTFTPVSGSVSFSKNGTRDAAVTQATAGDVVKATYVVEGKSYSVNIVFTSAIQTK